MLMEIDCCGDEMVADAGSVLRLEQSVDLGHASRLIHGRPEPLVGSEHRRASSYPQAAIDASPVKVCANSHLHSTDS